MAHSQFLPLVGDFVVTSFVLVYWIPPLLFRQFEILCLQVFFNYLAFFTASTKVYSLVVASTFCLRAARRQIMLVSMVK